MSVSAGVLERESVVGVPPWSERGEHTVAASSERLKPGIITLSQLNPEIAQQTTDSIRAMRLGGFVLESEKPDVSVTYGSMHEMLEHSEHDEIARQGAHTNIKTMFDEGLRPHTNVVEVTATVDDDGRIWQYGQDGHSIVSNALRLDDNEVSVAESETLLNIGAMVKSGDIQPGDTVFEAALVPNGDAATLRQKGYFVHTMSYIARFITLAEDNKTLNIQSHFLAGVNLDDIEVACGPVATEQDVHEREQYAFEHRADKRIVSRLFGEILCVPDAISPSAAGFLRYVGKLDKGKFPKGALNIIPAIDAITAEEYGVEAVFYGVPVSEKPDYESFLEEKLKESAQLDRDVDQFLALARSEMRRLKVGRDDVPTLLRKLSKAYIAGEVIAGRADPLVLGARAAPKAMAAMEAAAKGRVVDAERLRRETIDLTQPGGCPLEELAKSLNVGEDQFGSLSFYCQNKHYNTRPYGKLIPKCTTCGVSVKCD